MYMRNILKNVWYWLCKYILIALPDNIFYNLIACITYWRFKKSYRWMDINCPTTFNEKIQYLKLHPTVKDGAILADKFEVREYIKDTIGEQYLIPLLGVWDRANRINFDELPNQFVLKTNHGSGWNIICTDKKKLNLSKSINSLNRWLKMNAYFLSREWQYKNITPLIIAEQFLEYNIYDYKFFCFNGNPRFVQVDIDRFSNHKRLYYDMDWRKLDFSIAYPLYNQNIQKPSQFEEMKLIVQKLSKDYSFVRIDLYIHDQKVYFGEITLYPEGGSAPFIPKKYNRIIGEFIHL